MTKLKAILGMLTIALSMVSMSTLLTSKAYAQTTTRCFACTCSNGKCICVEIQCPTKIKPLAEFNAE